MWEKWFAVFAKLSFNFNYNLVESYILNFPSHPSGEVRNAAANFDNNFNYNF